MRLIVVDGLDGVGKDTHAIIIKERYEKLGEKVILRSHPEDDNFFGRKAKKALLGLGKFNKIKASIFYLLDVLMSVRKYYRKKEYDTLIMVRYLVGTAYIPEVFAKYAYRFFYNFVPTSEYMFFLDAPPKELLRRFEDRTEKEIFENYNSLLKVRKKALKLVKNWHIIDTTGTVEETSKKIINIIEKLDKS